MPIDKPQIIEIPETWERCEVRNLPDTNEARMAIGIYAGFAGLTTHALEEGTTIYPAKKGAYAPMPVADGFAKIQEKYPEVEFLFF